MNEQVAVSRGVGRIAEAFVAARAQGRAALIPYLMAAVPDAATFVDIAVAVAEAGADVLEVGLPFSDPLADGPTIQRAAERALADGMTTEGVLALVEQVARRTNVPIVVMGYSNPVLRMGIDNFCGRLTAAGGAGVIVADMPPEEAAELRDAAARHGLGVMFLVAPTSSDERIREVAALGSGFLYCVSLTGVTGARTVLPVTLEAFLDRVRGLSSLPIAVGFGIATPEQVRQLAPHADAIVVGSALVARVAEAGSGSAAASAAAEFVAHLARATVHSSS